MLERSVGRRGEHVRAYGVLEGAQHSDSARRRRASPSSVRAAAAGTARRSRCSRAGSRAGRSAAGRAGSVARGAVAGGGRQRGAARPHHTLAAATSSARRTPGAHGWSPGRHSWRGWPTPAHSPIRPPPSTRRGSPR